MYNKLNNLNIVELVQLANRNVKLREAPTDEVLGEYKIIADETDAVRITANAKEVIFQLIGMMFWLLFLIFVLSIKTIKVLAQPNSFQNIVDEKESGMI